MKWNRLVSLKLAIISSKHLEINNSAWFPNCVCKSLRVVNIAISDRSYHFPEWNEIFVTPENSFRSFPSPFVLPACLPHHRLIMESFPVEWIDNVKFVIILIVAVDVESWSGLTLASHPVDKGCIALFEVEADSELSFECIHIGVEAEAIFIAELVDSWELAG